MFTLICLVFAFVLCAIAAFIYPAGNPPNHYPRLVAAALAFFFLACILGDKIIATRIGN